MVGTVVVVGLGGGFSCVVTVVDGGDGDGGRGLVGQSMVVVVVCGRGGAAFVGWATVTSGRDGMAGTEGGKVFPVWGSRGVGPGCDLAAWRLLAVGWLRMELHGLGCWLSMAGVSAGGLGQVLGFPRNCEGLLRGLDIWQVPWGVFWFSCWA